MFKLKGGGEMILIIQRSDVLEGYKDVQSHKLTVSMFKHTIQRAIGVVGEASFQEKADWPIVAIIRKSSKKT